MTTNSLKVKMNIPLLDLKAQYASIKGDVDSAVKRVIESQYFILSEEVSALEKEVAAYSDAGYAAGCASGTDALVLALRALGIGKGDKVITSPFTFFASAEAVSLVGATPVFVDIDPDTYNMDPDKVEELMASGADASGVKAVIPVHIYGQCADMTRVMAIAEKYGLKVVEDCAQAIGALHSGKKAGSFADAGAFSFFPSKNLGAFGDGGMVTSSDPGIIERVKKLRVHGSTEQYIHDEIAYNSRLDSLQAAVLRVKLKKLDAWIERRAEIAEKYNNSFNGTGIKTPVAAEGNTHTYHQYTIAVRDRDRLAEYLNDSGIAARVYYPVPLHLQPCYRDLSYKKGDFPVAEKMSREVVSLPVYPELTGEQTDYIIQNVKSFFSRGGN